MNKTLSRYLEEVKVDNVGNFYELLNEGRFSLKHFGIVIQNVNNWRREDLLFINKPSKGFTPYSFIDYVWVQMIYQFKEFGLHFDVIRDIKKDMMLYTNWANTVVETKEDKQDLKEIKNNPDLFRYFNNAIALSIHSRQQLVFWVNVEGKVIELLGEQEGNWSMNQEMQSFLSTPFISINATTIIQNFILNNELKLVSEELDLLSWEEAQVIELMEEGLLKELKVHVNHKQTVDLLTKKPKSVAKLKKRFIEVITTHDYNNISYATIRGLQASFQNTNKVKLNTEELMIMN